MIRKNQLEQRLIISKKPQHDQEKTDLNKDKVDGCPHTVDRPSNTEHSLPAFQALLFPENVRNHLYKMIC